MTSALYYKPSNKCSASLALALPLCVVAAYPFAWLYAWICYYIPEIIINFFASFGYAMVIAALVAVAAEVGNARNPWLMAVGAWVVGTAAWYLQWACWWNMVVHDAPRGPLDPAEVSSISVAMHPRWMLEQMGYLYHRGAWEFHHVTISGGFDVVGWLAEYLLIVGIPIYLGYSIAASPYCEGTRRRAKSKEIPARLQFIKDCPTLVSRAELQPDALPQLLELALPLDDDYAHLTIEVCGVGEDNFASLDNVTVKWKDGKADKTTHHVFQYLRISYATATALIEKWSGPEHVHDKPKRARKPKKAAVPSE
ncbi:MAG TPA: hypothetical protein VNW52_06470 [Burkholderiaceae bacterium]|jgi:hypothetical protein|nr:hypothetical protein [Burkholderiaceae bacterium]